MPDRFYRGMKATEAMGQLNGLNSDVQAVKDATVAGVASAAQSAAQAAAARDAALQAWGASTAPAEQLAAISRSVHNGAVVDVFLYDTSKDSDGGAWRNRCKHTSWENEARVSGKWLGQFADTAAARAAGGVTGDYYQSTYSGIFVQLTATGDGFVEVFRGNIREFPALAVIVAEAGRVVIYDATKPDLPMWMVFVHDGVISWSTGGSTSIKTICMLNGKLMVGMNGGGFITDFVKDDMRLFDAAPYSLNSDRRVVGRNTTGIGYVNGGDGYVVANYLINEVAATVLPDAPIDPATGLPVPTVAVATAGGLSVVKHDGTVVNSSYTGHVDSPSFGAGHLYYQRSGAEWGFQFVPIDQLTPGFAHNGLSDYTNPSTHKTGSPIACKGSRVATRGAAVGVILTELNPASATKSMAAIIANAYSSGWQVGDSRGAWLADTAVETVSGGELVVNGTFDAGTTGWTAGDISGSAPATLSVVSGRLRVTNSGGTYGYASQAINTQPGKTYVVSLDFTAGNMTTTANLRAGDAPGAQTGGNTSIPANVSGRYQLTFVASLNTTYVTLILNNESNGFSEFDNISVRLADKDRSVKGKALAINGTITKAPVDIGAQLVMYSGFTSGNYLDQPYNADLDFGTGDFCIMGWIKDCDIWRSLALRGHFDGTNWIGPAFTVETNSGGVVFGATLNGWASSEFIGDGTPLPGLHFIAAGRKDGNLFLSVDGKVPTFKASGVANGSLSSPVATLRLGSNHSGSQSAFGAKMALWRIGATAPSTDQIAQIYRDELALFQRGAQCTINGNPSQTVDCLAYDDSTDLLHVGTNWGYRSAFRGLQRVEAEHVGAVDSVGGVNAMSTAGGAVLIGGTIRAKFAQPPMLLRDELRRRRDARQAMAREEIPLDFDGTAAQTLFPLPIGLTVKGVFVAGTKKRRGPTKDYTVTFDGYRETVVFGVSPGATWVQITATRSL